MPSFTIRELSQLLNQRAVDLRSRGVAGVLKVAPATGIKCFVPCAAGSCI